MHQKQACHLFQMFKPQLLQLSNLPILMVSTSAMDAIIAVDHVMQQSLIALFKIVLLTMLIRQDPITPVVHRLRLQVRPLRLLLRRAVLQLVLVHLVAPLQAPLTVQVLLPHPQARLQLLLPDLEKLRLVLQLEAELPRPLQALRLVQKLPLEQESA